VKERLRNAVAQLGEVGRFDEARLYQEAVMLAAKADIREELDRLARMSPQRKSLSARAGRSGAGSTSWRRSFRVKPTRFAPSRTIPH